jgi:prepilin-type N-terminal cleavage/methylation domain-containing protein
MALPVFSFRLPRGNSFTLIELLVVIAIIAILAALTLSASEAVMNRAARSRATAEIQAASAALESYKSDNGVYPLTNTFSSTKAYSTVDPTSPNYIQSSQLLYQALSGKYNYNDNPGSAGVTNSYMNFKANQLGNVTAAANSGYSATASTYVKDPWGYSYGYYTGDINKPQQNPPYNGTGFYDLWSTGGSLTTTSGGYTNSWISNWTQ